MSINEIGQETKTKNENINELKDKTDSQPTEENKELQIAKEKYKSWWISFVLSLLPLMALPLWALITWDKPSMYWLKMISSCEIIFAGISLVISSLNDINSLPLNIGRLKIKSRQIYILLLLIGAIIYGIMTVAENQEVLNPYVAIVFNAVYIVFCLVIGSAGYISEILRAK